MSWRFPSPPSPLVVLGGAIIGALVIVAVFAPLIAPYDPRSLTGDALERPSAAHLFGTNDVGRDIFSEVVWGTRASLTVALLGASIVMVGGVLAGVFLPLLGGTVDRLANRIVVMWLALPGLPLLMLVAAMAGPSPTTIIAVIALIGWAPNSRVLRSQTLSLRQRGFVASARGFGAGPLYLVRRHFLPRLGPLVVLGFVNWAAISISLEAGLSFLGVGDPTGVSWGQVLNRALGYQGLYFGGLWTWWVLPVSSAITLAVLGFTFVGVGLEPSFNPRWRRNV
ncbi:MAG: ABC transporter permease [Acidimicrobiales bacterium]